MYANDSPNRKYEIAKQIPAVQVGVHTCRKKLVFAKQTPRHTRRKTGSRRKNLFLQNKCRPDRSPPISLMEMKQGAPVLAHAPAPGYHLRRGDGRLLALVEIVVARPFLRMPDVSDWQHLVDDGHVPLQTQSREPVVDLLSDHVGVAGLAGEPAGNLLCRPALGTACDDAFAQAGVTI